MQKTSGQNSYEKRPLWQWIVIYLVIGGIIYAGVYYFFLAKKGGYSQNQMGQYASSVSTEKQSTSPGEIQEMQEITIEGNEFAFTPAAINVKQGEIVKITFKNTGKYPHNFTISELNIRTKTIQPEEHDSIELKADKTGSFTYVCTVDSHTEKGMKGTLTVR